MRTIFQLSAKNQVIILKWVRAKLNVKSHQRIQYQPFGKHSVILKSANNNKYQNIFKQPGLTRNNFDRFMKSINMPNNNDLVGKEKWPK